MILSVWCLISFNICLWMINYCLSSGMLGQVFLYANVFTDIPSLCHTYDKRILNYLFWILWVSQGLNKLSLQIFSMICLLFRWKTIPTSSETEYTSMCAVHKTEWIIDQLAWPLDNVICRITSSSGSEWMLRRD